MNIHLCITGLVVSVCAHILINVMLHPTAVSCRVHNTMVNPAAVAELTVSSSLMSSHVVLMIEHLAAMVYFTAIRFICGVAGPVFLSKHLRSGQ